MICSGFFPVAMVSWHIAVSTWHVTVVSSYAFMAGVRVKIDLHSETGESSPPEYIYIYMNIAVRLWNEASPVWNVRHSLLLG